MRKHPQPELKPIRKQHIFILSTVAICLAAVPSAGIAGNALAAPADANSSATPPGQGTPPGQVKNKPEHDQGDDHASAAAKLRVSTHDNPSARRSAIVDQPPDSN